MTRYIVTVRALATIEETWAITLPDGADPQDWEQVSDAMEDGSPDLLGERIIGDEGERVVMAARAIGSPDLAALAEAVLWQAGEDFDGDVTLHPGMWEAFVSDYVSFLADNSGDVSAFMEHTGRSDADVAHDYALTRNRHGAGFWDRCYCGHDEAAARLTEAAHADGEYHLFHTAEGTVGIE